VPTAKLPRVTEKAEQAAIVQLLRSLGASVYVIGHPSPDDGRTHRGTGQTDGIPDLYVVIGHRAPYGSGQPCALWIEVKAKDGKLRAEQDLFRRRVLGVGHYHIVGGLDAVLCWLAGGGWVRGWVKRGMGPQVKVTGETHVDTTRSA
jgi:hypothetical protein